LHEDNIAVKNPDWVIHHGSQYYLDPGLPEVQSYLIETVEELVSNYDVDAVHMDDYFYPGVDFDDEETFDEYGDDFDDIGDWRRDNVNELVRSLDQSIKEIKPWVQFGISPSGIWRNVSEDPTGSETDGQGHYDALFADSRYWIREEIIDYITPQIYWSRDLEIASYSVLLDWWSQETADYDVNLYIGMADYKVNNNFDEAWDNPYELPEQILDNRDNGGVQGQMHFTLGDIFANRIGYQDIIEEEIYNYKSLTPEITWNGSDAPESPAGIELTRENNSMTIQIENDDEARKYAIYRSEIGESIDYNNPEHLVGIVYNDDEDVIFTDDELDSGQLYNYGVTSLSNTGIESTNATEKDEGSISQMKKRVDSLTNEGEIAGKVTAHMIDLHLNVIDHYEKAGQFHIAILHMYNLKQLLHVMENIGMISSEAKTVLHQYADVLLNEWR